MPGRKKDQPQVLAKWWKIHTFASQTEIQERLQQLSSQVPISLTSPSNTPALFAPHALPRLDERGLSHGGEEHKRKRKPSK